jgi:hypothetical protein
MIECETERYTRPCLTRQATREAEVPKFEYMTLRQKGSFLKGTDLRRDDLEQELNRLGGEGWELITINMRAALHGERDGHLFILKRELATA